MISEFVTPGAKSIFMRCGSIQPFRNMLLYDINVGKAIIGLIFENVVKKNIGECALKFDSWLCLDVIPKCHVRMLKSLSKGWQEFQNKCSVLKRSTSTYNQDSGMVGPCANVPSVKRSQCLSTGCKWR